MTVSQGVACQDQKQDRTWPWQLEVVQTPDWNRENICVCVCVCMCFREAGDKIKEASRDQIIKGF